MRIAATHALPGALPTRLTQDTSQPNRTEVMPRGNSEKEKSHRAGERAQ